MVTTTDKGAEWAFLLHRLPREPSAPRIALWRALRRLGAQVLGDGLVGLPASGRAIEHLEWLASSIEEQGGSASVWVARPLAAAVGDRLVVTARASVDSEYQSVIREAGAGMERPAAERRRLIRRLRAELRRIGSRDYHAAPSSGAAREAVDRLTAAGEAASSAREGSIIVMEEAPT